MTFIALLLAVALMQIEMGSYTANENDVAVEVCVLVRCCVDFDVGVFANSTLSTRDGTASGLWIS